MVILKNWCSHNVLFRTKWRTKFNFSSVKDNNMFNVEGDTFPSGPARARGLFDCHFYEEKITLAGAAQMTAADKIVLRQYMSDGRSTFCVCVGGSTPHNQIQLIIDQDRVLGLVSFELVN